MSSKFHKYQVIQSEVDLPQCVCKDTEVVSVTTKDVKDISLLYRFPVLDTLILHYGQEVDISTLPHLYSLRHLHLKNTTNAKKWINALQKKCPNITELIVTTPENIEIYDEVSMFGQDYIERMLKMFPYLRYINNIQLRHPLFYNEEFNIY